MEQLAFWSNEDSKVGKKIISNDKLSVCKNITKNEETRKCVGCIKHDFQKKQKIKKECKKIYIPKIISIEEHYPSKPMFFLY